MSLASQQAALLQALLADGPAPAGFSPDRLRIEADVLRRKHSRLIAYLRPDLEESLGDRFFPLFAEFTAATPKTTDVRTREYAAAFETWLRSRSYLPRPGRRFFFRRRP